MKRSILSTAFIAVFIFLISCATTTEQSPLIGKWKNTKYENMNAVLEIKADNTWTYSQDGETLDSGAFEIVDDKFILKHEEGEAGHGDHEYTFTLDELQTELSLIQGENISVYKKIE